MKPIILFITILIGTVPGLAQQNMDISFLRGLGNTCSWDDAAAQIDQDFQAFTTLDLYGPTTDPIQTHDINYQGALNAVVGHSMGGLVARSEIVEGDDFEHLITIGTPHLGAPMAAQGGNIGTLVTWWVQDVTWGPCAQWGGVWCYLDNSVVDALALTLLPALVELLTPLGEPSVNQMIPGSTFLNNLNSNFAASLPSPTSNNRFIYGIENWQEHYRLLQSSLNDCAPENGNYAGFATILGYLYAIISANNQYYANYCLQIYYETNDWWYYFLYQHHMYVAIAWDWGAYSLLTLQQLEWSAHIDGALTTNNYWSSDGVVPSYSQVAYGLMPSSFRNHSLYTNHLEETKHSNAVNAVIISLIEVGVY